MGVSYRTQKIQARIICISGIATLALGAVLGRLGQLAELFWSVMIGLAVVRFNLMPTTLVSTARDILRAMSEGIILLGRDSRIIDVNDRTMLLSGRRRDELIGKPIAELLPQIRPLIGTASERPSTGTTVSPYEIPFRDRREKSFS